MTYQELLEDYLFSKKLRPESQTNYRRIMNTLVRVMNGLPLEEVDRTRLLHWRKDALGNGLAPTSWNTYVRHLKALFNHGINYQLIPFQHNPFDGLSVTSPQKKKKTLDAYQLEQTLKLFDELQIEENRGGSTGRVHPVWFWRVVYKTLHQSGIRRNQLKHLRVRDVNFVHDVFRIQIEGSKTYREYDVPIRQKLKPWIVMLYLKAKEAGCDLDDQLFNVTRLGWGRK